MRIAIATDAWSPQVNGVVTTLQRTRDELVNQGHEVVMITPEGRRTMPCPTYPEIRLTLFSGGQIARELDEFDPDCEVRPFETMFESALAAGETRTFACSTVVTGAGQVCGQVTAVVQETESAAFDVGIRANPAIDIRKNAEGNTDTQTVRCGGVQKRTLNR